MSDLDELRGKLNAKQQIFANGILEGKTQRQAYIDAGYEAKTETAQDTGASEILRNPQVKAYIEAVQAQAQKNTIATREEILERLTFLMRTNLNDVVHLTSGDIVGGESSTVIKKMSKGADGKLAYEAYDQIVAMKQISKMQGYDAPTEIIQKSTDLTHEQLEEELTKRGLGRRPNQLASKKNEE